MLKRRILVVSSLLLLVFGSTPFDAKADENLIKGNIYSSVWTEADSPYIIDGTVEVSTGARLTIEPGALIKFNKGGKIVVKGEFRAIGVPQNKIILTSNSNNPQRGDWGGIEFANSSLDAQFSTDNGYSSGSIMKNVIMKYSTGINCNDASPYIANNDFINNTNAIEISGTSSSPGVEVLSDNLAASNYAIPVTMLIENNSMIDGDTAIKIGRNNGRDFINTPAGKAFSGNKYTTAILRNNVIENNVNGIVINRGDNDLILGNTIRYNNVGINLAGGSGHFLQENNIFKNNTGLNVASQDSVMIMNTVKSNLAFGINLQKAMRVIKYNDIVGNKVDLDNNVGDIDVSSNYWGAQQGTILDDKGTAAYSPALDSSASLTSVKPIIEAYPSVTNANNHTVVGIKPYGTELYVDNVVYSGFKTKTEWSYPIELVIGDNEKTFSFVSDSGVKSQDLTVKINREKIIVVETPTVSSYASETSKGSITISGTKQAGASIWISKSEVIPVNSATTWSYNLPLAKGANSFNIFSKDINGVTSQSIDISIIRTEVDSKTVAAEEKALTKADAAFAKKMAGKLLLQVEKDGSIWYVNPKDAKRYVVINSNLSTILKSFATGISEKNLATILYSATKGKDNKLGLSLKGKFLLRVEAGGKLCYVDMNGYRHDIGSDVLKSLVSLSQGITNANIRKIDVGGL